jgi:hypothetical protein
MKKIVLIEKEELYCDTCGDKHRGVRVCDICGHHRCVECTVGWGACKKCPGEAQHRACLIEQAYNEMSKIQDAASVVFHARREELEAEMKEIGGQLKS